MEDDTAALIAKLQESNAELAEATKMLNETRREVEASARESRAAWAAVLLDEIGAYLEP